MVSECFLLSVDVADSDATSCPSGLDLLGLDCVGCGSVFMWFGCGQCSHILHQGLWFQGVFIFCIKGCGFRVCLFWFPTWFGSKLHRASSNGSRVPL